MLLSTWMHYNTVITPTQTTNDLPSSFYIKCFINEWKVKNKILVILNITIVDLGCLPDKYRIVTDPEVPTVIDATRKVPVALKENLEKELKRMVDLQIIEAVNEPSDWISSIVTVEKPNGALRVCLDPKNLNKAIKRHHHQMPTTEEILSELSEAKYFTKLDASNAYWQIRLDEDSCKLLNFNTHIGRFRFLRMPFGIHSASEICQVAIGKVIAGIHGSRNSQDDILIWGATEKELNTRTCKVLTSVEANGLKLNKSKCIFNVTELTYLGHKISQYGIEADPTKVEAITKMPYPTNKK